MNIINEDLILDAAKLAEPREACGVVCNGVAFEVENVANDGTRFFIMDMVALGEIVKREKTIDAVWHSHPNGDPEPSSSDLHYHPKGRRMLIVAGGKVHDHGVQGS
jgi:proteasome lid subunit RPN8/RPN11